MVGALCAPKTPSNSRPPAPLRCNRRIGMTQKKKKTEKYGKRTIMIPPEINKLIDKLPEGSRSAWIVDAIRRKLKDTE